MEFSIKTQMDVLRQTLGVNESVHRGNWGYRNRICVAPDRQPLLDYMVENGLMVKGDFSRRAFSYSPEPSDFFLNLYHATELGCQCLGFTREEIRRTLED
jgi:hypothetical protein